jgi:hypothetical protein
MMSFRAVLELLPVGVVSARHTGQPHDLDGTRDAIEAALKSNARRRLATNAGLRR